MLTRNSLLLFTLTYVSALPQQTNLTEEDSLTNDDKIVPILIEIKNLLTSRFEGPANTSIPSVNDLKNDIIDLDNSVQEKVRDLEENLDKFSDKGNQNVEIMMQSFSALKILATVQSEQIKHTLQRLDSLETNVENFHDEINKIQHGPESNKPSFDIGSNKNPIDLFASNSNIEKSKTEAIIPEDEISRIKDSLTSMILKELGQRIDTTLRSTDGPIQILRADVSDLKRDVRKMKNEMDEILTQLPENTGTRLINGFVGDCSCQQLRSSLTRLTQENIEHKKINTDFNSKLEKIVNLKNETGHENFTTALINSRIETLEKQIEILPKLEETAKNLQNFTCSQNQTHLPKDPLCVHPYTAGGGGCFYIHTKDRYSWQESREYCQTIQGDLANPLQFDKFRQFLNSKRLSRSYNLWLGASDEAEENNWTWLDGRLVESGSKIWTSGKPSFNSRSNCMEIRPTFRFVAGDDDCRSPKHFVCEQRRI